MGLFGLACTALSAYVWSATVYDVYKPLSQTLAQAAPSFSPAAIASTLQRAIFSNHQNTATNAEQQAPTRRGRRRKHLTLAEAQREELRDALKIFVIWLTLKGCEPLFDHTIGYVLPFYTLAKALILVILARFRAQLFKHAFDSFVVPLGKPNTPLINATAFTELILPTLRFLLSLPFAHLSMAIKNAVLPYLASWTDSQQPEVSTAASPSIKESGQRVAPPVQSDTRKVSGSLFVRRRDDRPRDPGAGGASLKHQRSIESLQSRPRHPSSSIADARARSASSRTAPINQHTINTLADLPSVPNVVPSGSILSTSTFLPPTFANIPAYVRKDIVAPPSQKPVSYLPSISSPRMPGSLSGSPESSARAVLQPPPPSSPSLRSTSSPNIRDNLQVKEPLPFTLLPSDLKISLEDVDVTPKRSQKGSTPRAKRKASEKADGDDGETSKALASPPKQRKRGQTDHATEQTSAKSRLPVSQSRRNIRTSKDEEDIKASQSTTTRRKAGDTTRRAATRTK